MLSYGFDTFVGFIGEEYKVRAKIHQSWVNINRGKAKNGKLTPATMMSRHSS